MDRSTSHIAFGPVPSRRLGQSLGINNIPAKTCSYSCVYCQVGPTTEKCIEARTFWSPQQVSDAVGKHLAKLRARGLQSDYLTFVPDGEPTLAIAAVHPMREPAVRQLLTEDHADWTIVADLLADGKLMEIEYLGELFYLRPVRRV